MSGPRAHGFMSEKEAWELIDTMQEANEVTSGLTYEEQCDLAAMLVFGVEYEEQLDE